MGELKEFTCPNCGYRAEVSDGDDCGMVAETRTMTCLDCRRLVDVLVGVHGDENMIRMTGGYPKRDIGRCPRCRGTDIEVWAESWPCPRCGTGMDEGETTLLWD